MRLPEWSDPDKRDAALAAVAARIARPDLLTKNELAVLFLESHGIPRPLVAAWLHLTPDTVTETKRHARHKLFAATSAHAVATALRLGLIS